MTQSLKIPIPEKPRMVAREGQRATFEIAGLYPGYGVTLGNALRRVLLSSLSGAAVTEVSFSSVGHEFSTIPGVRESVLDIILNLKRLRLKLFSDEPQILTLKKKGEGEVTSDDLKAPAQVGIVSSGLLIATLTDRKAEIDMELVVESGVGYVPAELRKREKIPIGRIAIDAVFTPVRVADFTVEHMRVGDRTDYNRLLLTVETDGTLVPEEAFAQAARILVEQFSRFVPEGFEDVAGAGGAILKEPLATLGLSGRVVDALEAAGIRTVAGLLRKREKDIAATEGIGDKALVDIRVVLKKHGLALKP